MKLRLRSVLAVLLFAGCTVDITGAPCDGTENCPPGQECVGPSGEGRCRFAADSGGATGGGTGGSVGGGAGGGSGGGSAGVAALVFTGTVSRIRAAECTEFTVARQDGAGADWPVSGADELINLATDTAGVPAQFFADAACQGSPVSSATMAVGSATASFFVSGRAAGTVTLSASRTGLTTASRMITIAPGAPVRLVLLGPLAVPTSIAGACAAVTVQLRDVFDNPSPATSPVSVMLSSNASGAFSFSPVSNCVGVTSSVTIPVLSSEAQVYFRADRAESVTLTGNANAFNPATLAWRVTPGPPSRLAFTTTTAPAPMPFTCAGPLTVQVQDALGNPAPFTGDRTFEFVSSNASVGMLFSVNQGCAPVLGSPAENSYTSPAEFSVSLLPRGSGTTLITVVDKSSSPLASTTGLSVTSTGTRGSLTLTTAGGVTQVEYGGCLAVQAQRLSGGSPWTVGPTVLNLSGATADLTLHSDSACSVGASSVTIADGAATASFYVKGRSTPAVSPVTFVATDASATFPPASTPLSALPLVRRGQCVLTTGMASCAITLNNVPAIPGNDISRTLLVFQARGSATAGSDGSVACHLSNAGPDVTVDCRRFAMTGSPQTIFWQTASWAKPYATGGVTVAHRTVSFGGTTSSVSHPHGLPMSFTDLDRSFLLFSSAGADTGFAAPSFPIGYLGATTTATFAASSNFPAGTSIDYQVVQMSGLNVERSYVPGSGFAGSITVNNLIDRGSNAALLHSVLFGLAGDTSDICRKRVRGTLPLATSVTLVRGDGATAVCPTVAPVSVTFDRLSFPTTLALAQSTQQPVRVGVNVPSNDGSLAVAVTPDRTLLFFSGQGPGGQASGETAASFNNLGICNGVLEFGGSGAVRGLVTVSRAVLTNAAVFSPYAVEFVK